MDSIVYFLTALLAAGLPLNLLVFWSLRREATRSGLNKTERHGSTTNAHCRSTRMLRSHINLADLVIMCCFLPINILSKFGLSLWLLNSVSCKVVGFVNVFGFYLSSNVVTCVAIDRVLCTWNLSQPAALLAIKRHTNQTTCGLPAAWIAAVICSTPHLVIYDLAQVYFPNQTQFNVVCTDNHQYGQFAKVTYGINETSVVERTVSWYHIAHTIVIFPVPCLIMIGCYSYVVTKLYKNCRAMKRRQRVREIMGTIKCGLSASDLLTPRTSAARQRSEVFISQLKYTYIYLKSTAAVVSYILCWAPYYITTFSDSTNHWLSRLYYLILVNSIVNPIVFLVNSRQTNSVPVSTRRNPRSLITHNQSGPRYGTFLQVQTPSPTQSARTRNSVISSSGLEMNSAMSNRKHCGDSIMLHVIEKPISGEHRGRACYSNELVEINPENSSRKK